MRRETRTGDTAKKTSISFGQASGSTTFVDSITVSAHHFSQPCTHGCGSLALQESPTVVGDEVRIRNNPLSRMIALCLWQRRPVSHVVKTLSSSWTKICWRTENEAQPPRGLNLSWTERCAENGPWEVRAASLFRYRRLPVLPQGDAIRLLSIHLPDTDGRVNTTISEASLSQKPFFYAISYEWGPVDEMRTILLNGRAFQIRNNLFDFLTVWSKKCNTSQLWIDAICINQEDMQEKAQQVTLMGDIYQTATCVQLWLGDEADNSGALLRHFRQEGRCIREFSQQHSLVTELPPTLDPTLPDFPEHKVAVAHLLRRSYWTRAWIVQELVLARDITVHCGSETISWSYLRALASGSWSEYFDGTVIKKILEHKMLTKDRKMMLLDILGLYPDQQCQSPHDQVYSLLSLDGTFKSGRRIIDVDYEIDPCSLLLRTFNACEAGILTRDAAKFERLRLRLGLGWDEVLESTTGPKYVKEDEPWYNADRPFDIFAQVGVLGDVVTVEEITAGSYAGLSFITSDESLYSDAPVKECGLSNQAEVADHIFELFGTSVGLIFRPTDQMLTFVGSMILVTVRESAREDVHISNFEHQLLLSGLFHRDDPKLGWTSFVRLSLVQWAAICGCLTESQRAGSKLPKEAGLLPDMVWEMVDEFNTLTTRGIQRS